MKKYMLAIICIALLCPILYWAFRPRNKFEENVKDVVARYVGTVINLPDSVDVLIEKSSLRIATPECSYKLLTVVDAAGCSSCKMQLREWEELLSRLQAGLKEPEELELIYVLDGEVTPDILATVRDNHFRRPIVLDTYRTISKQNDLPNIAEFKTFLLDESNKVLALGNPILFEEIGNLYASLMQSNIDHVGEPYPALASKARIPLGVIDDLEEITAHVMIKNVCDSMLKVISIESSCPCVTPFMKYPIIRTKGESEILIHFTPSIDMAEEGRGLNRYVYVRFENIEEPLRLELYAFNELGGNAR